MRLDRGSKNRPTFMECGERAPIERALDLDASNERALYGLGLCRLYGEDQDGALEQFVRLKRLGSDLADDLYKRIYP